MWWNEQPWKAMPAGLQGWVVNPNLTVPLLTQPAVPPRMDKNRNKLTWANGSKGVPQGIRKGLF